MSTLYALLAWGLFAAYVVFVAVWHAAERAYYRDQKKKNEAN